MQIVLLVILNLISSLVSLPHEGALNLLMKVILNFPEMLPEQKQWERAF